jgi:hypothetical protein
MSLDAAIHQIQRQKHGYKITLIKYLDFPI